ncbi:thiosulfate sulfurtransferase 16, chloroplastic-like [Canna indica]|uniref:Thiosulfate sulfurtransferase 16, chloroplastic-like n=1 Tax=Canna indica TaxID=4628 RepID=A0AAQ3QPJ6_9LILI|nr:thiosulfate sulfurtransferase 16, chloroplastic-like [Canna indica]
MTSVRLLRLSRHLAPLLRRVPPTAALRPLAPPHVLHGSETQRPVFWSDIRSTATNAAGEEAAEVPRSVPVTVAHDLLKAGHRFLDVRTAEEFSDGHVIGAINIPYMFKAVFGMTMKKNSNFIQEVSSIFKKDDDIIVGCRSGKRSLMAASELSKAGFTEVTDVAGGYMDWVKNRLPSEQ